MKERVKQAIKHPLIYGSGIVVIGSTASNFFNFLFNLFMSRNLSIDNYGTLATIMSIIGIPMLLASAISPMVIKFAGDYFAKNNFSYLRSLYLALTKFFFFSGFIICLIFLLFLNQISAFFHIEGNNILTMTAFVIFVSFLGALNMAFLQAKLAFRFQGITYIANSASKLLIGIILVLAGFSISGAVLSILLSAVVSYLVSFIPLGFVFNRTIKPITIETKSLFSFGVPSMLTSFGLTSFIATDIILVKHFFDPMQAGLYAGLSLVGRVIFYLSGPIGTVMFPIIVQKHSKNENFVNTLKLSLLLVFVPSVILTILYFLFPNFVILFFLKKVEYLTVAPYLGLFGMYICLYGVVYLLSTFYLSIKKTNIYIPITIGALLQIVLICFYHTTIMQVIMISLTIMFLLVIMLLLYYPYATKK